MGVDLKAPNHFMLLGQTFPRELVVELANDINSLSHDDNLGNSVNCCKVHANSSPNGSAHLQLMI